MINENVPLAKEKPIHSEYKTQQEKTGILIWKEPEVE